MERWQLEYDGQIILLPEGESLVGRARGCRLRFADLAVSRLHLRLVVSTSGVVIEDLGSQGGTMVNDAWLREERVLADGDRVRIGSRRFRIQRHQTAHMDTTTDSTTGDQRITRDVEELPTDLTAPARAAASTIVPRVPSPRKPRQKSPGAETAESIYLDSDEDLPSGLQRKPTIAMRPPGVECERRQELRVQAEIQAIYSSDILTCRGLVRDLSSGGVFLASDLLDPPGTACRIALFPEGHSTVQLRGIVRHVVRAPAGQGGRPPGVGIKLVDIDDVAKQWLDATLDEAGTGSPP